MSKVWLVTGSASGLGRNIAEAVLASGDRLVATARDPRRLEDLVDRYGDLVRTATLDVADEKAAYQAVQVAAGEFGRLDVVVNNAGYGAIAPFEQLSPERFKAVIDTNFYGVVYVTRAAIPIMRKQKSGCILHYGVMRIVIRPGWLKSFFAWLPVIDYRHISCWGAMPFSTPTRPKQRVPTTNNAGGRSAFRQIF